MSSVMGFTPKPTVRYTFDRLNRLRVQARDPKTRRLRAARTVRGTVTTDRQNRLVYRTETEPGRHQGTIPHKVTLDGTWRLTAAHDLKLTLRESMGARRRQTVHLIGALSAARANALTFALRHYGAGGRTRTQHLTLTGHWTADRWNRLAFLVRKASGRSDRLTFQSAWTVDRRHTRQYRYQQRGSRRVERLQLRGSWALPRAGRLAYHVEHDRKSVIDVRAAIRTPTLRVGDRRMVYEVGIRLRRGRRIQRRVTLFGAWKLQRDLSMRFEIQYADGQRRSLQFQTTYRITPQHEVTVALRSIAGQPIGVTLTLTKRWLDDAAFFVHLRNTGNKAAILGGAHVRF